MIKKAIEKDFEEQGLDPENTPKTQQHDEYHLDFKALHQLIKSAIKYELKIKYLD